MNEHTKEPLHLSEPAGQTGWFVNGVYQFEGLILGILQNGIFCE